MLNSPSLGKHNVHSLANRHESSSSSVTNVQQCTCAHDSHSNYIFPLKWLSSTLTNSHAQAHFTQTYTHFHTDVGMFSVWQHAAVLGDFFFCFNYPLNFNREPLPTVFSMLHPLDEIAPAVCKPTGTDHTNTSRFISYCPPPLLSVLHSYP